MLYTLQPSRFILKGSLTWDFRRFYSCCMRPCRSLGFSLYATGFQMAEKKFTTRWLSVLSINTMHCRTQCCETVRLKGQCHEIFCFWFFSWISFLPAPEYSIKTVSNFFENSRRYSQLKVCHRCQRHRWQMEKIFNQKNFNNFVWSPLGSRGNIYINFCLQVSLWGVCSLKLFPLFATGVNDTGGKFAAGVVDCGGNLPPASLTPAANLPPVSLTPVANLPPVSTIQGELMAKFAAGVVDTGGAPWLANISANFRKNLKWS